MPGPYDRVQRSLATPCSSLIFRLLSQIPNPSLVEQRFARAAADSGGGNGASRRKYPRSVDFTTATNDEPPEPRRSPLFMVPIRHPCGSALPPLCTINSCNASSKHRGPDKFCSLWPALRFFSRIQFSIGTDCDSSSRIASSSSNVEFRPRWAKIRPSRGRFRRWKWGESRQYPRSVDFTTATNDAPPEPRRFNFR